MSQTSGDLIPFNLSDHFVDRHVREGRAGNVAIRCGGAVRTFGDLAADINRAGNGLLSLGLEEEQRVLLLLPDCPEFAVAYFGVIKIGAVVIPTSTFALTADYGYFLNESKARVLIVHSMLLSKLAPILGAQRCLRHVIIVGEPQRGCLHWDEWLIQNSPKLEAAPTSAEDVAFWLWTSGSTGRPKAAVHLHHDWLYCCRNYGNEVLGIGTDDITFSSSNSSTHTD